MGVRPVVAVVDGEPGSPNGNMRSRRFIGTGTLQVLDPFLMLSYFQADRDGGGFPDHPHRGFETVTYMLAGRMHHGDSHGNQGVIGPGGAQWMTAARGIVHSEFPECIDSAMSGFQLWVNLPAARKMDPASYQEVAATGVPVEQRTGATVRVVAGVTSQDTAGPLAAASTDARLFEIRLDAGTEFSERVPPDHTVFLLLFDGELEFGNGETMATGAQLILLGPGEQVVARAGPAGAGFLLVAGRPLQEPVAWGGPFVMNTREEVVQAYRDYQSGQF